jgi:LuxR family transcriptional regulator, maltose regulon positive regulatory protein
MSSTDVRGAARLRGRADVDDPVLMSKVTVPEVPGWAVARPRIEKLIAEGAGGPLTSVTGPPGAGKTMAIASWAAARTYPCTLAWVTLDDYDNKPRVFWSYVVAALRRGGITVPRVLPGPTREAVEHVFLVRLASVLAAQDSPVVLVLDDLHLLTDPATLDGLDYVQRNAHPGLHLVVASRVDPLLPLHRYRLTGELTEIRADDLAFTVEESGLLLAHHGITLSKAALAALTGRTEGWVAGIRLAALSLHGHPDPEQFVKELEAEDSAITGYLVDEVLNAQPAEVRDMLLRTSILDCVNADLASELADDPHAAHVLPDLARANAFVRPIGHGWYRYHSLLAAVLRLKLRIEHSGRLPGLYERAARWYQRHGMLNEAARYAAESGDWPFAAGIVVDEFAVGQLIDPRGNQPLAEALERMPQDEVWTQPQPWLVLAAMGLSDPVREASSTAALAAAEHILERLPADAEIPARLAASLIRLALSRRTGDVEAATAAAGRAEILAGQLPMEAHARHPELAVQLLSGRGTVALWAGRLDAAAADFTEGMAACGPETGYEHADCLGYLALVEAVQGQLSRAAGHADEVIEVMRSVSESVTEHITSAVSVALACVHLQRGDMQEAHAQLKRAEAALRICPDKLVSALACLVAAQRRLAESRTVAALEMIRRARQDWSPPGWLELRLTILESRAHVLAGDLTAAVAAAQSADPQSVPEAAAALAHAWLVSGDHQAARRALDAVAEAPEGIGLAGWLVDARLSYGTGEVRRGRRSLERALLLAKPERMKLPFVMEQAWMRQVLRRDPELAQASREMLEPAAAAVAAVPAQRGQPPADQQAPLVVERLSEREREVLVLLSGMLSTAEIASEMYLSVNTVKTHLRSIYRKLSAAHRGEAVRRARQLQLILDVSPVSGGVRWQPG